MQLCVIYTLRENASIQRQTTIVVIPFGFLRWVLLR